MKKIWLCPKCGSASKRNANIKRHGITVHGETVVPVGYDPLLQKLSMNEQVTYHTQGDSLPFFFHPENKDSKKSKDTAISPTPSEPLTNNPKVAADLAYQDTAITPTPSKSLTNNLKEAADLADQYGRLKKHGLFSGASSSGFNNFMIPPPVADNVTYKPITIFTAYVCSKCATGIIMAWNALTTPQAVHERSCKSKTFPSNTANVQKIQSTRDSVVNQIISLTEKIYPSKRYVQCLAIDEIATIGIKLFNLVELDVVPGGHWATRAYHDQKTEINREETREFITVARANIAVFKAKLNTYLGYYLLWISD
jgi:hypothetical protein